MDEKIRNSKGQFVKKIEGILIDGMKSWVTNKGYRMMWYNNKNKLVHVYIWEKHNNIKKPYGFEIHHKNKNKLDNRVENLILIDNSTHQKIHKGWELDKNNNFIEKPCTLCNNTL